VNDSDSVSDLEASAKRLDEGRYNTDLLVAIVNERLFDAMQNSKQVEGKPFMTSTAQRPSILRGQHRGMPMGPCSSSLRTPFTCAVTNARQSILKHQLT
jgi:hypothetical protein